MRYLTMIKSVEGKFGPPPAGLYEAVVKLGEDATKAGVLVETGGLLPAAKGTFIRFGGDKTKVMDGPYTEAKELVGGYAVYEVKSKDEVMEWVRRFINIHTEYWPGFEGEVEVREMFVVTPGR